MDRYIKVDWPESQEWIEMAHYDTEYGIYECENLTVFVPEKLYNRVNRVKQRTI